MRFVSVAALGVAVAATVALTAAPADAQSRRYYRADRSERITFIDENGRARTKITVRPRSYLDGGPDRRVGPDWHASLPAADAVRAAGLFAVFVLVISLAPRRAER